MDSEQPPVNIYRWIPGLCTFACGTVRRHRPPREFENVDPCIQMACHDRR